MLRESFEELVEMVRKCGIKLCFFRKCSNFTSSEEAVTRSGCQLLEQSECFLVLTELLFRDDSMGDEVQDASLHECELTQLEWVASEAKSLLDRAETGGFDEVLSDFT